MIGAGAGRAVAFAGVAAVLVATAAGCGGLRETRLLGSSGGDALTTTGFGLGDEIASTRVDLFRARYPGVRLQVNEGSFDAQQFLSAVAAGRPPDLAYLDRDDVGSYAQRGALQALTDCVPQAGIRLGDFRPAALAATTVAGTVYGIPEFNGVRVLLVNDRAAAEAGVRPQDVDTSDWAALRALGQRMNRVRGGKPSRLGLDPKLPEFLPLWTHAAGGDLLSADGRQATVDTPAAVEALAYGKAVYDDDGGYPAVKAFTGSWDLFGAKNQFVQDQIGIMPMDDWYLNVLADVSPDAPVTVLPFRDRQGRPMSWSTGNAWVIPKGARHPDQACRFIATVTGTDAWLAAAKARAAPRAGEHKPYTGTYTGNAAADRAIFATVWKPSGNARLDAGVAVLRAVQEVAFATPPSPAGAEVKDEWTAAANRVLFDGAPVGPALGDARRQAQAAIDATNAGR
jgi:multiple sugar transport system substrate-binding protein